MSTRLQREKNHYNTRFQHAFDHLELSNIKRRLSDNSLPDVPTVNRHHSITKAIKRHIPNVEGKRILIYGCGTDLLPSWFSLRGAIVDAIDISDAAIQYQNVLKNVLKLDLNAFVADAHNTTLPDEQYELIVGKAILHHLSLNTALHEIHRLLVPNGLAVFRDVLQGNLFTRFFRKITPYLRTNDEYPLRKENIQSICSVFNLVEFKTSSLIAQIPTVFFIIINRVWKIRLKFINNILLQMISFLDNIDQFLLRLLPFLKYQTWLCVIVLKK